MSLFKNASPQVVMLGADDKSIRSLKPEADPIPQHLPLFFTFARKGTTKRVLLGGAKAPLLLGSETFDMNKKYFNHQTRFLNAILGTGNTCMVQRLVPEDAGPKASACIYVDVLPTMVPNYVRNSLGDYVIDLTTNSYKIDKNMPQIPGYKIKLIKENHLLETDMGLLRSKQGTMKEADVASTMYPIIELKAKEQGEYYNNIGIVLSSIFGADADSKIMNSTKGVTYNLSLVTRENQEATPTVFRSLFGEPSVQVSLKPKAINPNTEARFDIEQVFNTQFFNETDALKSLKYFDYEGIKIYREMLETVYGLLMAKESEFVSKASVTWDDGLEASTSSWFDYTTDDKTKLLSDELYMLNIFSCRSSKNVKYFTFAISEDTAITTGTQKEITLSANTPVFLSGGSDGTLNSIQFETLVRKEMDKYLDADSEVQDLAINVESIIYDTGFDMETKKSLFNFIALRKDTVAILATHSDSLGERELSLSDTRARGVALRTRANLAPESEWFGTGVARALIMMSSGNLRDGTTGNIIPSSYELAIKAAKMMGAGNGKWKKEYLFDNAPGNILNYLINITPKFIPAGIKPTLWNDGLVWAQPYDRVQYHFPQLQTVYDNDTSVLNSFFNVMALATLNKIGADAWRQFTGTTSLTENVFKDAVVAYVNERLKDKFADMITVIPEVVITEGDALRGYSWQLVNKMYANNAKTVMVYHTEVYRASDLNQ